MSRDGKPGTWEERRLEKRPESLEENGGKDAGGDLRRGGRVAGFSLWGELTGRVAVGMKRSGGGAERGFGER